MSLAKLLLENPEVSVEEFVKRDDAILLEEVSVLLEDGVDLGRTAVENLAHSLIAEGVQERPEVFQPIHED